MKTIKHKNLLGIEKIDNRNFDLLIFMEFSTGGDLHKLYRKKIVANSNYFVPEETILFWAH